MFSHPPWWGKLGSSWLGMIFGALGMGLALLATSAGFFPWILSSSILQAVPHAVSLTCCHAFIHFLMHAARTFIFCWAVNFGWIVMALPPLAYLCVTSWPHGMACVSSWWIDRWYSLCKTIQFLQPRASVGKQIWELLELCVGKLYQGIYRSAHIASFRILRAFLDQSSLVVSRSICLV